MDINEFILLFSEIFDDTDISQLKPDTCFRDLPEWSSLTAIGFMSMAESEFGIRLKAADLRKAITITDLHDVVIEAVNN